MSLRAPTSRGVAISPHGTEHHGEGIGLRGSIRRQQGEMIYQPPDEDFVDEDEDEEDR